MYWYVATNCHTENLHKEHCVSFYWSATLGISHDGQPLTHPFTVKPQTLCEVHKLGHPRTDHIVSGGFLSWMAQSYIVLQIKLMGRRRVHGKY